MKAWTPFIEKVSGRQFVICPSSWRDNEFIDTQEYEKQLLAATATNSSLRKAWVDGDWYTSGGSFFSTVLSEKNLIQSWPFLPDTSKELSYLSPHKRAAFGKWEYYLSHDYGVAAPSVTYLVGVSPGMEFQEVYYPKNSIVLIDELASYDPNDLRKL